MGNVVEQIKGKTEVVTGAIESKVGEIFGNEQMQVEGKARELKGTARQAAASAAERVKGAVAQVKGAVAQVKDAATQITDDIKSELQEVTKKN